MSTFTRDRDGRKLTIEVQPEVPGDKAAGVWISTVDDSYLTVDELRWLCLIVGPAALAELERSAL